MHFPTDEDSIRERVRAIDPIEYGKSRNFLCGKVTHLSPYITHGYISLRHLRDVVLKKYSVQQSYTFIFELAWREFFQRTWEKEGDAIFWSLKHPQENVVHESGLPEAYLLKKTGIQAIDNALVGLEAHGYVHNHARMWMAMLVANISKTSWWEGARHMYYHLLDGDRASNTLSWQWVAGTFSAKQYVANQEMINKYALASQYKTYLDKPVNMLLGGNVPDELSQNKSFELVLDDVALLRESMSLSELKKKETWLYSMWTLDPYWQPARSTDVQKILFIDMDDLAMFPMSAKRITFFLALSKNILDLKVFYGKMSDLETLLSDVVVYKKHHPALFNWPGEASDSEYLFPEVIDIPGGFMSFWKKCERYL